jgi:O-antigen ligase
VVSAVVGLVGAKRSAPLRILKVAIYLVAVLLPFEGILGNLGLIGGMKIVGLLVVTAMAVALLWERNCLAILLWNLRQPLSVFASLFILWSLLTALWAPSPAWALLRSSTYLSLFVLMHSIALLGGADVRLLWKLLLVSAAVSVPLGWILPPPSEALAAAGRFTSGGKDPNDYANLLVVAVAVGAYGVATDRSAGRGQLGFLILCAAVASVGIALSLSRTAWVNLAVTTVAALLRRASRRMAVLFLSLGSLGLILTLAVAGAAGEDLTRRAETLGRLREEVAWAGRLDLWAAALKVFRDRPVVGIGAGNFGYVSPDLSPTAAWIAREREDSAGGVAHSAFLGVASETGLIGLITFLGLLFSAYRLARRAVRFSEAIGGGVGLGLLAYAIASLTLSWEYVKAPFFLYGTLMAIAKDHAPSQR